MINIYNADCMEALRNMDMNSYDLAICDPPYGIHDKLKDAGKPRTGAKFAHLYMEKQWDKFRPTKEYFYHLQRVSKNQIIFGGNYFTDMIPPSRGWIVWDKVMDNFTSVNHELVWTSFDKACQIFRRHNSLNHGICIQAEEDKKIHPTQKPIDMYRWILNRYTKEGFKILDTHLGSGSIAIAVHDMQDKNISLDGYEIDSEYYNKAVNRLKTYQNKQGSQFKLF